jgi:ABC-type glycerol-3-phosphate transport system substrate-binding protein
MVRFLKLASCALALGLAMVACGGGSSSGSDQATGSTDDKLTIVGSSS